MKYMGSKRSMLMNGLGELIREKSSGSVSRVVDLFSGAGYISWFVSKNLDLPVFSVDLQKYATILAGAVVERDQALPKEKMRKAWLSEVEIAVERSKRMKEVDDDLNSLDDEALKDYVLKSRKQCESLSTIGPIWNAYGGYYFSPRQSLILDYMLQKLPKKGPKRTVCLATIIITASKCAASPGHTAQPFSTKSTAIKFIKESWVKDPIVIADKVLEEISCMHSKVAGSVKVGNALNISKKLNEDDLVIIDPPYSGVQYSRFYHVLETIARGKCKKVSGVGRYPPIKDRPQSKFSNIGSSVDEMNNLLDNLAERKCKVIITYPSWECSNGLSGSDIVEYAKGLFNVQEKRVLGKFSTLGGNKVNREARKDSEELLLYLTPKSIRAEKHKTKRV